MINNEKKHLNIYKYRGGDNYNYWFGNRLVFIYIFGFASWFSF